MARQKISGLPAVRCMQMRLGKNVALCVPLQARTESLEQYRTSTRKGSFMELGKEHLDRFQHLIDTLQQNDPYGHSFKLFQSLERYEAAATDYDYDFVVENQRGMKMFGIPLFLNKALIPVFDPATFQLANGKNLSINYDKIDNFHLPDLDWVWAWPKWYVLMLNDVDDQGWLYLGISFRLRHHWKGKYYFGNFVRRRIWVRLRQKKDQEGRTETRDFCSYNLQ